MLFSTRFFLYSAAAAIYVSMAWLTYIDDQADRDYAAQVVAV